MKMNDSGEEKFSVTIIRNSECLPSDSNGARLWRSGIFAQYFHSVGHKVSWVISSFDHFNKINRKSIESAGGVNDLITMLKTPGYKSNLSIMRFVDHFIFGVKLFIYLIKKDKSDVLICSYPTPESAFFTVLYGMMSRKVVIIDVRDKWPDVMFETFKGKFSFLVRFMFSPYWIMKKIVMKKATCIMAANPDFLSWAVESANREIGRFDFVSYIPFLQPEVSDKNESEAKMIIDKLDIKPGDLLVSFAGTLGLMFDFEPLYKLLPFYFCLNQPSMHRQ
mgnify:FL=1